MTEFGDLNQLVRQLEDLHQAEERVKGMTREKIAEEYPITIPDDDDNVNEISRYGLPMRRA